MKFLLTAAVAANVFASNPSFNSNQFERALQNYQAVLAGRKQLGDLNGPERRDVMELDRLLHSRKGIVPSETREQCMKRLGSDSASRLEKALLDLKCSQRPAS